MDRNEIIEFLLSQFEELDQAKEEIEKLKHELEEAQMRETELREELSIERAKIRNIEMLIEESVAAIKRM
jgi:predicted  nucleic acid-binding Zn-ribbon protein